MEDMLQRVYLNNSIQDYLIAFGVILIGIVLIRIFRRKALNRLKLWAGKTETSVDDFLVNGIERFGLPLLNYLIVYSGLNYLTFSEKGDKILKAATAVVIAFYVVRLITSVLRLLLESHVRKQEHGEEKIKQLKGVTAVFNFLVWSLGGVFLFDNLGYDVTAVITGLGIGGIAIALAAQNILGDLFNYFVIFFDRPFEIGDYIEFDNKKGTVEHIGIKTTRLKSIGGEQLILSNSDLTKTRVHNFKRMNRRRISFTITVTSQTKAEHIKEISGVIKRIIDSIATITFERAHFLFFTDLGFTFEIVYFVDSPEYSVYAEAQQQFNIQLIEYFQSKGIEFASPPQAVVLAKGK